MKPTFARPAVLGLCLSATALVISSIGLTTVLRGMRGSAEERPPRPRVPLVSRASNPRQQNECGSKSVQRVCALTRNPQANGARRPAPPQPAGTKPANTTPAHTPGAAQPVTGATNPPVVKPSRHDHTTRTDTHGPYQSSPPSQPQRSTPHRSSDTAEDPLLPSQAHQPSSAPYP